MEQRSYQEEVGLPTFKVRWHRHVHADLAEINAGIVENLVVGTEYRLSRAPAHIGIPLKGTAHRLWRIGYAKYWVVYTINIEFREVWVLSVQQPEAVLRHPQIL